MNFGIKINKQTNKQSVIPPATYQSTKETPKENRMECKKNVCNRPKNIFNIYKCISTADAVNIALVLLLLLMLMKQTEETGSSRCFSYCGNTIATTTGILVNIY